MPSTHIDHVIRRLEYVIQWSKARNHRIGYFAALYERVTIEVDRQLDRSRFSHGDLMHQFDVIFAEYFLLAFDNYMRGENVAQVWKLAFDKAKDPRLTVLQHLLMGMNAHINLDLAVTVSNLATPETLHLLKPDFYLINEVLASLVDLVQDQLGKIYPKLGILDRVLGRVDETIVDKLMGQFRDNAWKTAEELTGLSGNLRVYKIHEIDYKLSKFAEKTIARPLGNWFKPLEYMIRKNEQNRVSEIIEFLHDGINYEKWDI